MKDLRSVTPGTVAVKTGVEAPEAVAEKLAQPDGKWAKFDRSGWKALVYPDPKRR